ncbi:hypothetical protein, partial [Clostridium tertium]|uniref:hypothetical protein n=1 Tax=Clostridium tertium TaxID=1559 RepID=UPI003DA5FA4D
CNNLNKLCKNFHVIYNKIVHRGFFIMRKILLLILASLSVFTVSCNNTKILEENTKDNEVLNKYKI